MDKLVEGYLHFPKELRHEKIYKLCEENMESFNIKNQNILNKHHNLTKEPWHEKVFSYMWLILVQEIPSNFKFLEIGVFKGRVLSLIELLNKHFKKNGVVRGITPLSTSGDKYSRYPNLDYYKCIQNNYTQLGLDIKNINIIQGYSQEQVVIQKANDKYDIIFIDGCHDYESVCKDIENYSNMIKKDGFLVMDDCACHIEYPYSQHKARGVPYYGYLDVSNAIKDKLDTTKFKFLFALSHNIVWQKII